MATQAQILANRRNAQKSTGPRTAGGKAVSAKNATKHGLFAQDNVVISENQADFDALRDEMVEELDPVGVMESILAERIVSLTWRLKRAERMQNELIDVKIRDEINGPWPELSETLITGKPCDKSKYSDKCYDDQVLGYVAMRDFRGARALERLSMYEKRIESSLYKAMSELQKLHRLRKKEGSNDAEMNSPSPRDEDATLLEDNTASAQNKANRGGDAARRGQDAYGTRGRDARDTGAASLLREDVADAQNKANPDEAAAECGQDACETKSTPKPEHHCAVVQA
jgi:hypothetical protein